MSLVGKSISFRRRFPRLVCRDEWLDTQDRFGRVYKDAGGGIVIVETLFLIDGKMSLFLQAAVWKTEITGLEE